MWRRGGLLFWVLLGLAASACSPGNDWRGLGPKIEATDIERSTNNYLSVRNSLVRRAGLDGTGVAGGHEYWYQVTLAGFHYVDEKCNAFIGGLFAAERVIRAGRNQINDIGSAVTAILSYTVAAREEIGIVASAFGLASKTIDNAEIVFLVELGPARVKSLVEKARKAYRGRVYINRTAVTAQSIAMDSVAGYLDICRVPTIAALIARAVDGANATTDTNDGNPTNPSLLLVGGAEATAADLRDVAGVGRFVPSTPTKPVVQQPARSPQTPRIMGARRGTYEPNITLKTGNQIQTALCVPETGNLNDGITRVAIRLYEAGNNRIRRRNRAKQRTVNGQIDNLVEITEILRNKQCKDHPRGYQTAYEKFRYPAAFDVEGLQFNILEYIKKHTKPVYSTLGTATLMTEIGTISRENQGKDPTFEPNEMFKSGIFDTATREAILLIVKIEADLKQTSGVVTPEFEKLLGQKAS